MLYFILTHYEVIQKNCCGPFLLCCVAKVSVYNLVNMSNCEMILNFDFEFCVNAMSMHGRQHTI